MKVQAVFALKPSAIAGVGVFALKDVAKGDVLRLYTEDDVRELTDEQADADPEVRAMREIYCVKIPGGWRCPLAFQRMSLGWHVNHSFEPNVAASSRHNDNFVALRPIKAGEEIL